MSVNRKHIGSSFDSFLKEQGIRDEVRGDAAKMARAFQLLDTMKKTGARPITINPHE